MIRPILLASILLNLAACAQQKESTPQEFGWDEDLTLKPGPPSGGAAASSQPSEPGWNNNFCFQKSAEECFTLIIRVPTSDVVKDLSLSALAMASGRPAFQKRMEEACFSAWNEYKTTYQAALNNPLRRQWVTKVKDFQCVFSFFSKEYVQEDAALPKGHMGASVRLSKFEVDANTAAADMNYVKFTLDSSKVKTSYRSAFLIGSGSDSRWRIAQGVGPAPKSISRSLGREFGWKVEPAKVLALLKQIDVTKIRDQADQATKNFFKGAQTVLGESVKAQTPVGPAMLFVGLGYHAWRDVCGEDSSRCHFENKDTSKTASALEAAEEVAPSSESNEFLRIAIIQMVEGLLDSLFESVPAQQIKTVYKLD